MKKYNILLTNHELEKFGGSETYCYAFSKWLSTNHNVTVYSPRLGEVSDKISQFAKIIAEPVGEFDIVFHNHNNTVSEKFISPCKIYTTHGIFPKLEQPPKGMDAYVAISKEIADHFSSFSPVVLYNGIDTDRFCPNADINRRQNLLFSSNYDSNLDRILKFAALTLGLRYRRIGRNNHKSDVVKDLAWADIVVGIGRTALEALSCGKKVIAADKRGYSNQGMDGLLTSANVEEASFNNYSGRAFKKSISFFTIRKELKTAINDQSSWERSWILKNHDITKQLEHYLELAESILEKKKCP